tara:strand:+ start:98 stop:301 length:204 start_codon:yes stop_codon:yes gene_type:complete
VLVVLVELVMLGLVRRVVTQCLLPLPQTVVVEEVATEQTAQPVVLLVVKELEERPVLALVMKVVSLQ